MDPSAGHLWIRSSGGRFYLLVKKLRITPRGGDGKRRRRARTVYIVNSTISLPHTLEKISPRAHNKKETFSRGRDATLLRARGDASKEGASGQRRVGGGRRKWTVERGENASGRKKDKLLYWENRSRTRDGTREERYQGEIASASLLRLPPTFPPHHTPITTSETITPLVHTHVLARRIWRTKRTQLWFSPTRCAIHTLFVR